MVDVFTFRQIACSFPNAEELPHFDNTSFRIKNKIFATLKKNGKVVCVKLSEKEQSLFCCFDPTIVFPVENKWGKQGWTNINLNKIEIEALKALLKSAYDEVSQKKPKTR